MCEQMTNISCRFFPNQVIKYVDLYWCWKKTPLIYKKIYRLYTPVKTLNVEYHFNANFVILIYWSELAYT